MLEKCLFTWRDGTDLFVVFFDTVNTEHIACVVTNIFQGEVFYFHNVIAY